MSNAIHELPRIAKQSVLPTVVTSMKITLLVTGYVLLAVLVLSLV